MGDAGVPADISIHAPTRGATVPDADAHPDTPISIHAPTRGATNPIASSHGFYFISIHAPTRGATLIFALQIILINKFQFTHLHEVRPYVDELVFDGDAFQFTHLHEVRRLCQNPARLGWHHFNSRTYTRCDLKNDIIDKNYAISIHAPTRGATVEVKMKGGESIFQFTHLHEVRRIFVQMQ